MARSEKVTFPGSQGEDLDGLLDLPPGPPVAYALFAHCFTCSKDVFAASRISKALTRYGVAVLRFDFTGLGASGGEFANTNFSSNVADLEAAADVLRSRYEAPKLLIGHSFGGAAVVAVAPKVPEAVGVVTVGAPSDPSHVEHLLGASLDELESGEEVEVRIGDRAFTIHPQFLEDIREQRLDRILSSMDKALLVLHSPGDEVVDVRNGEHLFQVAAQPRSFVCLPDADHLLTRRADAVYVADLVAAWATRYLGGVTEDAGVERGVVRVREIGTYTQEVTAGPHHLLADEPPGSGQDLGPTPYDLLLASLGACTSITLRMYAERKDWPLEDVEVPLTYDRQHAEDCEDCESEEGFVHRLVRVVEVTGDLDEEQRRRLLEIADRCPVHRTLIEEKRILTRPA